MSVYSAMISSAVKLFTVFSVCKNVNLVHPLFEGKKRVFWQCHVVLETSAESIRFGWSLSHRCHHKLFSELDNMAYTDHVYIPWNLSSHFHSIIYSYKSQLEQNHN